MLLIIPWFLSAILILILFVFILFFFFFQAEDGIRDRDVTGVQTCALPIFWGRARHYSPARRGTKASRVPRRRSSQSPTAAVAAPATISSHANASYPESILTPSPRTRSKKPSGRAFPPGAGLIPRRPGAPGRRAAPGRAPSRPTARPAARPPRRARRASDARGPDTRGAPPARRARRRTRARRSARAAAPARR